MLPNAGAEFAYLAEAFPAQRWIGFAVGLTVVAIGVATAAAVALAFGGYLRSFVDVPTQMSALALLIAVTAVNLAGIRESSGFNIVLTSIEALGLVVAIARTSGRGGPRLLRVRGIREHREPRRRGEGASRVLYSMARAGELPAALGAVRARSKVPWLAIAIVFAAFVAAYFVVHGLKRTAA